ncbi:hypothetical protein ASF72_07825 [Arthrobacter sp. Leaf141]|uniref:PspC domain-containing protein n=1 Tax=Arthrobacter sp. Leaf141 TaxID=1736273 RepID=UPI000700DD18|nr:PspC domain-containing protein [Arthrobacter sp. Leaf141]KQR03083.1 hypothetical protein ASF72_07825 [Arthrobacter sp. Leaf141]
MNSQTPTPDDPQRPDGSQPTEPLPQPGSHRPTEPLPAYTPAADAPPLSGPAGAAAGPTPTGAAPDFFDWIRGHGIQRGSNRWVGGVCDGIAQRLGIDPLIIRGVFIVLTLFAGIGVLAYGLAWAFLPEPDGRIHVQEAGAGHWSSGMTGSLIATILGLTGLGGGFWGWSHNGFGGFLWTVFWVGGAIYLVYYLAQRNKGSRPARVQAGPTASPYASGYQSSAYAAPYAATGTAGSGPVPGAPGAPASAAFPAYGTAGSGTTSGYGTAGGSSGSTAGNGNGGYGNYGGTGRPPQGPARPQKPRPAGPGAPAIAITAGTALLVGGGLKALDAGNIIDLGSAANAIVWASAAAVLGLGILVCGARGRTAGILSLFAVVALIAGGVSNVVGNGDRVRFSEVSWSPTTLQDARNGFDVTAGRGTVDLTDLAVSAPLGSDVVIPLDITASNVTVVIPENVPVRIEADMTMGNLSDSTGERSGSTTRETSYNTDKPGSSLVVEIDGTFSNVTIEEGN